MVMLEVLERKSKMLEQLGYSRIFKLTKATNFYKFQPFFAGCNHYVLVFLVKQVGANTRNRIGQ